MGTDFVRSIGVGATNFLLSKFKPAEYTLDDGDLDKRMLKIKEESIQVFSKIFKSQNELATKIREISTASKNHAEEVKEVVGLIPGLLMFALDIDSGILAGIVSPTSKVYCEIV